MRVNEMLQEIEIGRLDAEVLLAQVLKKDRSWVLAHPEYVLTKKQESQFEDCVKRRRAGEPVAYIIGEKEFYGRKFKIDSRVLIPRPSTEGFIELVLENIECRMSKVELRKKELDAGIVGVFIPNEAKEANVANEATIVDIGTGSGCIAITLALELLNFSLSRGERAAPKGTLWVERGWKNIQSLKNQRNYLTPSPGPSPRGGGTISNMRIIATDISVDALDVAKDNAKRHGVEERIEFRQGDLLEPIMSLNEPFIIVANPPYLKKIPFTSEWNYEPEEALFAGREGMDVLIPLIKQAKAHPYCMGIFLECQEEQLDSLSL